VPSLEDQLLLGTATGEDALQRLSGSCIELSQASSVRSVLYLYPKNDDYSAVVDYFRKHRILELAKESGGGFAASLHVPTSGRGPMLALATWRAEEDYLRWVSNPNRAAFTPGLAALLDRDPASGETYRITGEVAE